MKRFDFESQRLFTESEYVNYYLAQLPNEDLLKAQFNNLPIVLDSETETLRHIKRVNEFLSDIIQKTIAIRSNEISISDEKIERDLCLK